MIDILFDVSWYFMLYITIGFIQTYVLYLIRFKLYSTDGSGNLVLDDFLTEVQDALIAINMWPVVSLLVILNLLFRLTTKIRRDEV